MESERSNIYGVVISNQVEYIKWEKLKELVNWHVQSIPLFQQTLAQASNIYYYTSIIKPLFDPLS